MEYSGSLKILLSFSIFHFENRLIKFYDEVLRVSVRVVPSDLESLSMLPGDQMRVRIVMSDFFSFDFTCPSVLLYLWIKF